MLIKSEIKAEKEKNVAEKQALGIAHMENFSLKITS